MRYRYRKYRTVKISKISKWLWYRNIEISMLNIDIEKIEWGHKCPIFEKKNFKTKPHNYPWWAEVRMQRLVCRWPRWSCWWTARLPRTAPIARLSASEADPHKFRSWKYSLHNKVLKNSIGYLVFNLDLNRALAREATPCAVQFCSCLEKSSNWDRECSSLVRSLSSD